MIKVTKFLIQIQFQVKDQIQIKCKKIKNKRFEYLGIDQGRYITVNRK